MVKLKQLLTEGVFDKGILKAVFMAGGPGSGKSYVAQKLGLKSSVNILRKLVSTHLTLLHNEWSGNVGKLLFIPKLPLSTKSL